MKKYYLRVWITDHPSGVDWMVVRGMYSYFEISVIKMFFNWFVKYKQLEFKYGCIGLEEDGIVGVVPGTGKTIEVHFKVC